MLLNNPLTVRREELGQQCCRFRAMMDLRGAPLLLLMASMMLTPASAQQPAKTESEAALPGFEVAAIKAHKGDSGGQDVDWSADRVSIGNYTLKQLIPIAYGLKSNKQVSGGPEWMDKQAFDITAKIDDAEIAKMRKMNRNESRKERNLLLQSLLADRFQLRAHEIQQVIPVYALVVAKTGAKIAHTASPGKGYHVSTRDGHLVATDTSMDALADHLTWMLESGERVVLNETGLAGDYDFKMDFSPDSGNGIPTDAANPGLFTALQEQLGLKLESQKGSVDVIVVESAAKPLLD